MLSYIKKYPVSMVVILAVIYLSFFKPPVTGLKDIPDFDKAVHMGMYFCISGALWAEFLRTHRHDGTPLWHAWIGAFLLPILFGGCVELLQEHCTAYRTGDWADLAANAAGTALASLLARFVLHPLMRKKR